MMTTPENPIPDEQQNGKELFYSDLVQQAESLITTSLPLVTNLSNIAALIHNALNDQNRPINWTGFYLTDHVKNRLILGPFQGRVACTVITMGKGVCGTAAAFHKPIVVENVHHFKGHIACDSASESEIVIPLMLANVCLGVLDIDSTTLSQFDEYDLKGLEAIVTILVSKWNSFEKNSLV
ncbi:GAF domain-like protein [Globomyces pollinis-pini]|nr:GAF domain-like protein [Globomyces pollinis-pini]KAJ2994331.1 hypothetical protein HDV02_001685 [Globomyces sp. JEL0801]